jgi:hypothetical protein
MSAKKKFKRRPGLKTALATRRIDRRWRYLHIGSGSCQRHRPNDRVSAQLSDVL